jgi:RimJ/RimL family protein N-acetyltransferase
LTALRTPRLTLRPIAPADTEAIAALLADLDLAGPSGTGEWIFDLAGELVGIGRLKLSTELPGGVLELGVYLARQHRGTGLATEASSALLQHAFHTLAAPAVFALIPEANLSARALATRLGMLDVGTGHHDNAPHRILLALPPRAGLHHVEIWVPTVAQARRSWGWLLEELGFHEYQTWEHGVSWRLGHTYIVFEDSPARTARTHDRLRPGLNHLALHAGSPDRIEELVKEAPEHGWRLMFADRHPYAGGPDHYAAYLENDDGYEVELVASASSGPV